MSTSHKTARFCEDYEFAMDRHPERYSVGSRMVLAIGDLAGAAVVTLLAATVSLPEWVAMDDRDRSCRDRRGDRAARYGTRRVAQKSAAIIPFVKEMLSRRLFEQRGNPACNGNRFRILTNWPHDLQSYRHPVRSCECRDREARPPHQSPDTVED
jgi:hypothetical protein